MTAEIAARSVAHAQFLDQDGISEASLLQIRSGFWIAVELELVEGGGLVQQFGLRRSSHVLLQIGEALAEGQMLRKFDEADQVAAALTAVAVEQVLTGIDVKRGPLLCVQRAESHELL